MHTLEAFAVEEADEENDEAIVGAECGPDTNQ
jgi:hypothetical protein